MTVNRYMRIIRERIAQFCEAKSPFGGEAEVDELYFGARRVKGKRGRGAYGKTIISGILKRNGQVYTELIHGCRKPTLQAIIRGKVAVENVIYSKARRGFNRLVKARYGKHIEDSIMAQDELFVREAQENGIEGFWG